MRSSNRETPLGARERKALAVFVWRAGPGPCSGSVGLCNLLLLIHLPCVNYSFMSWWWTGHNGWSLCKWGQRPGHVGVCVCVWWEGGKEGRLPVRSYLIKMWEENNMCSHHIITHNTTSVQRGPPGTIGASPCHLSRCRLPCLGDGQSHWIQTPLHLHDEEVAARRMQWHRMPRCRLAFRARRRTVTLSGSSNLQFRNNKLQDVRMDASAKHGLLQDLALFWSTLQSFVRCMNFKPFQICSLHL